MAQDTADSTMTRHTRTLSILQNFSVHDYIKLTATEWLQHAHYVMLSSTINLSKLAAQPFLWKQ